MEVTAIPLAIAADTLVRLGDLGSIPSCTALLSHPPNSLLFLIFPFHRARKINPCLRGALGDQTQCWRSLALILLHVALLIFHS